MPHCPGPEGLPSEGRGAPDLNMRGLFSESLKVEDLVINSFEVGTIKFAVYIWERTERRPRETWD